MGHLLTPDVKDIEENGVRLHLTVVDTPGFGDFVNNDDRSVRVSTCLADASSKDSPSQLETDR